MQEYKIIFSGSMGAGKTTAIGALSDGDVVSTDVANTDKATHSKLLTTVGIDYGQILLPPDSKIALYGTPGQDRFEVIWGIVTKGALGVIVLIDSTSPKAPQELPYYIDYFRGNGMDNIVVGLTHTDLGDGYLSLDDCFEILDQRELVLPVFTVDPRQKEDILLVLETLLASIEADIS